MAFPTTAVLDTFDRANGGVGASWTNLYNTLVILSNQLKAGTSNDANLALWDLATFGNSECYLDIVTLGYTGNTVEVYARMTTLDVATVDGYAVQYTYSSGTDSVGIYRIDNATFTQLGATISGDFAAGDGLGIEANGSTITAYRRSSGTWSDISAGGRSDSTYGSAGYIGCMIFSTDFRCDNFGGGTIVSVSAFQPRPPAAIDSVMVY